MSCYYNTLTINLQHKCTIDRFNTPYQVVACTLKIPSISCGVLETPINNPLVKIFANCLEEDTNDVSIIPPITTSYTK